MQFICSQSRLTGSISIPGSKSHTIRAISIASLAEGISTLIDPLYSSDTLAAIDVYSSLGATCRQHENILEIKGVGGRIQNPTSTLDVGNSGTTLRIALGSASLLSSGEIKFTGDEQIQRRPCAPLVQSLNELGAEIISENGTGCAPFRVRGVLSGGETTIKAKTSQYVTSLLLCCPLASADTTIHVPLLYEKPYVELTLDWLSFQNIEIDHDQLQEFRIKGGQKYRSFTRKIPADFSSATFFLVAGALGGNSIVCTGLDMNDKQSDTKVVDILRDMGAYVTIDKDTITVNSKKLRGIDIDLNDCPDALPMLAVAGCFAEGTTRLLNVPQARIKETDRIHVMAQELSKLGANISELDDGLVINSSSLKGADVHGHGDHRVVMALAIAGTLIPGTTTIDTAESVSVTFPDFKEYLFSLGGEIKIFGNAGQSK